MRELTPATADPRHSPGGQLPGDIRDRPQLSVQVPFCPLFARAIIYNNLHLYAPCVYLESMKLLFFETPLFTRLLPNYLNDAEYRTLQKALLENPEQGDVMPGTGGFRKIRWEDKRRGKGKRSGMRVIYYYLMRDQQIWFFTIYGKNEVTDLTPDEKKALKKAIQIELEARR